MREHGIGNKELKASCVREHGPASENQEPIEDFPNYYNYETQEIQQKMGAFNFDKHGIPEFTEYKKLGPYRNK